MATPDPLKLYAEFKVIERCEAGGLLGQNLIKAYRADICESELKVYNGNQEVRIPITEVRFKENRPKNL
jgi:hypothetical protein